MVRLCGALELKWKKHHEYFNAADGWTFHTSLISKNPMGIQIFSNCIVWIKTIESKLHSHDLLMSFDIFFKARNFRSPLRAELQKIVQTIFDNTETLLSNQCFRWIQSDNQRSEEVLCRLTRTMQSSASAMKKWRILHQTPIQEERRHQLYQDNPSRHESWRIRISQKRMWATSSSKVDWTNKVKLGMPGLSCKQEVWADQR